MRRRLRGLSERDWRAIDRLFVVFLAAITVMDLSTNADVEGPLALNVALMLAICLSFAVRRSRPLVTVACTLAGLTVMSIWLTQPPDMFAAVLILVSAAYAVGRHLTGRITDVERGLP